MSMQAYGTLQQGHFMGTQPHNTLNPTFNMPWSVLTFYCLGILHRINNWRLCSPLDPENDVAYLCVSVKAGPGHSRIARSICVCVC